MKIAVLGIGRSGSTWISNIISKTLGGLILFEPFHPSVTNKAILYAYSRPNEYNVHEYREYLNKVLNKQIQSPWLLRNHLHYDIAHNNIDQEFISNVWKYANIIGFKSIRMNFMIDFLKNEGFKIIFIDRNIYAIYCSILKRNFWEFNGLNKTYKVWLKNIPLEYLKSKSIEILFDAQHYNEKIIYMLVVTKIISSKQLTGIKKWKYEDFYLRPFEESKKLIKYLGFNNYVHPSFLFESSVTTNKTFHGRKISLDEFWKPYLSSEDKYLIDKTLNEME